MEERLLEIKDLHVEYVTDEARVFAVNGLDLTVMKGETVGLVERPGLRRRDALSIMRLLPERRTNHRGSIT